MSYTQHQQAEIDPYIQMECEESWKFNYPELPDTYLSSSFGGCSLGTDQIGNTIQPLPHFQETDYQHGRQVSQGLSEFQYLLRSQDQTFFTDDNIAQADWSWPEPSQVWLRQDSHEMEQVGDTIFLDDLGYPKSDDRDHGIQTSNRKDQVQKGKVHIVHVTKPVLTEWVECHKPWSIGNKRKSKRSSRSAKACTVKRVYGTEFLDSNGNTVDHLVMPSIRDAAAFLGWSRNTVKSALGKTGDEKGVVLGVWKVEEHDPKAPAEIDYSTVPDAELSLYQQEIDKEPMSLLLSFINSPSRQSWSHQESLDQVRPGDTSEPSQSNLLGTVSSWQISQPLSSIRDGTRENTAAVTQSTGDAEDLLKDPAGLTWLTTSHSTPRNHPCCMPQYTVPGKTSSHRERGKKLSTRGHVVNLYHVSQQYGEGFGLEGKLVSSAFITTDRRVSAVTGASSHSLDNAKLHTNIELGVWRISYLGKIRKGEDVDQEIFAGVDPDLARSNPTGSMGIEGTISNQQEAMQHTTRQPIPAIVRKTVQRQQYRHSNMTRAKQSMHSANAKRYRVEQANGDLFEYDGQLVAFAIIRTVAAVTEFLNCPRRTLYRNLKANGRKKGIVKEVWRVREYKDGSTST
ncbi:hypothetical protein HD553DRAFT_326060 [Filobasidium floriforme]|uniref:uncharacterized protein n=1 Tax=Filobasidium floriforme TaxID=5210 RepID=UPI001E8E21FD|nr:uncharacterized protein HD553DRAFT_326060 [Filobasidium floriforme]KAH8080066.1 hypothetical protein HD553DRAFT_326060 [Filobasidium floriforme]